jgi:hypothetical protein
MMIIPINTRVTAMPRHGVTTVEFTTIRPMQIDGNPLVNGIVTRSRRQNEWGYWIILDHPYYANMWVRCCDVITDEEYNPDLDLNAPPTHSLSFSYGSVK